MIDQLQLHFSPSENSSSCFIIDQPVVFTILATNDLDGRVPITGKDQ